MAKMIEIPEAYQQVLARYAEAENTTEETAFTNLMDFIQLKDGAFTGVRIAVENPLSYLTDPEGLNAQAVLQLYMDIFGEDTIGAMVRGYYNPDRLDCVLLEIEYDSEQPVWDLLEMFHYKLPGMDILENDVLELMYVHDGYGDMPARARELFYDVFTEDLPDDGFSKAGYYENAFEEEEDFDDDEDFEDDDPAFFEESEDDSEEE